jgi:hypothetical protein
VNAWFNKRVNTIINETSPVSEGDEGHVAIGGDVMVKITCKTINSDRSIDTTD